MKLTGRYFLVGSPDLTDFCVSQPILSLDMTTESKFVFNTHINSSQEFLFTLYLRNPFKSDWLFIRFTFVTKPRGLL